METRPTWTAKIALACFFAVLSGTILSAVLVALLLNFLEFTTGHIPSFPIGLVSIPANELTIFLITILFIKYKDGGLRDLGLKRVDKRTLTLVIIVALPLFFLGVGLATFVDFVFGPDPMGEIVTEAVIPKNFIQLCLMIFFSLALVGPCEELAARGFIQKGFENSFGKRWGLLAGSILFGLWHGLNTLSSIIPVSIVAIIIGYTWQRTGGNTTATAVMHGVYDSIAIFLAYIAI